MLKTIQPTLLLAIILLVAACGQKPAPKPPTAVNVKIQQVAESNAVYYDEYPATVIPINQVELRPQVNGYVTAIHFTEGAHVKKGDALYSIDAQQYQAAYAQAQANVAVQQANLDRAKKDIDRYRELNKRDAVAKQLVDNAEATYEAAKKQVDAANAGVQSVQTNVRYTNIVAPFDGTIGISMVKLGTSVSAGQTVLNTISSNDPIAADIAVDQKEIFRFTSLQRSKPVATDSTFRLAFNGEVYSRPGKILVIDRAVNSQTGTIIVRVQFPNSDDLLRPGMSGTVRVLNNKTEKSILIPYKAVTEQLGEYFVYIVKTDSNKVSQQRVLLGKQVDRNVVIKTGLKDGDTIVTEGVQNLKEGSSIAVKTDEAPQKPGAAEQKPAKQ